MRFQRYLKEAVLRDNRDSIGLYVGRFQPLTRGHMTVLTQMAKENKMSYVLLVKGPKSSLDKTKNPFPAELQTEMINAVINANFKGKMKLLIVPSADIYKVVKENIPGKKFVMYCGPDREQQYKNFIKYFEADGMSLEINTADGKRTPGISGTDAREALINNDVERFKKVVPEAIHPFFDKLKGYLV